jgi:predicted ferric reductase
LWLALTGAGENAVGFFTWLLALDRSQATWYVSRSAGIVAFLMLWLSTVWGLALPAKVLQGKMHGTFVFEFHKFLSLLSIAFLGIHIGILLFDRFLPFSLVQLALPFTSDYRPVWVGMGTIGFYLVLLVTATYYLRDWIGARTFRVIHLFSLVGFLAGVAHGLFAGTDSAFPVMKLIYAGSFLSVVFFTSYWIASRVREPFRKVVAPQDKSHHFADQHKYVDNIDESIV